MDVRNDILWRIYVVMLVMLIFAVLIVAQMTRLQFVEGEQWRNRADSMFISMKPIEAPRGSILADDGSLLATSLPYFEVHMDTKAPSDEVFYNNVDSLAICLATYIDDEYTIGGYRQRLIDARNAGDRYLLIRKNITYPELQLMKTFPIFRIGNSNLSGFREKKVSKRQYPFNMLAHRTIGYKRVYQKKAEGGGVARDAHGDIVYDTVMVGIERSFDRYLSGESIEVPMQRVQRGVWIPLRSVSEIEPAPGKDIVTTLDVNIQDVAESALLKSLQKYQADHGCAIVMDVKTGQIKAMANIGFSKDRSSFWEDYNYAVGESVEPGSTFKLAAMLALFEDGYVTPNDTVNLEEGKTKFYDEEMVDATYHALYQTTVGKAFELSSNVGIAKLVHKYYNKTGREARFIEHLREMQLHKPVGVEIEGEGAPFIKDPDRSDWSGITLPWMSIGYELKLTALQMLTFYNGVANGGKMMRPYIVKEIRSYGEVEQAFEPQVRKRRMASKEALGYAKDLLVRVVNGTRGTARHIQTDNYTIAGKTGTAIINYKDFEEGRAVKKYRASFVGFFPAEDPVYSCIVMVTNPRKGYYGGTVAAPVFKEIADRCFATTLKAHAPINQSEITYRNETLPDLQVGYKQDYQRLLIELGMPHKSSFNTIWAVLRPEQDTLQMLRRNMQASIVPNVVGMGLRDALYLLENHNITEVDVVGVGKVRSQSIRAGRAVKGVRKIRLVLGWGQ